MVLDITVACHNLLPAEDVLYKASLMGTDPC